MKKRQQRSHLLVSESADKRRHHSLPSENVLPYRRIGGGHPTWQRLAFKDAVKIRRNLLERKIVLLVAVGAANLVEMLALRLLRSKGPL